MYMVMSGKLTNLQTEFVIIQIIRSYLTGYFFFTAPEVLNYDPIHLTTDIW